MEHTPIWDIHSHILPGVDDGAQSFHMSWAMINEQNKQNVTHIFATPHSSAFLTQY